MVSHTQAQSHAVIHDGRWWEQQGEAETDGFVVLGRASALHSGALDVPEKTGTVTHVQ